MKSRISRTNNNEAQWSVDVFLSKSERQQLLMYLSMDTAKALTVFKDEDEAQLAKDSQKDSAVILTMYPYPDLHECYTLKDNCYAVIPVMHRCFLETDSTIYTSKNRARTMFARERTGMGSSR